MNRTLLLVVIGLLALAAGCGGEDESSSEAWTDDFCSAASDWRSSLEGIVGEFQSPSDLNTQSIQGAIDDGLAATETFVDDVQELGAPETEAGQEVAGIVDSMTSSVETTAESLRTTFEDADSIGDVVTAAGDAAAQIGQLEQELESSLDELEQIETGELGSELESNEDCAAARGS